MLRKSWEARRAKRSDTYSIRIQGLKEIDGGIEEIHHFRTGGVVGIAHRIQRANTGAVLSPLVLPEAFRRARVTGPVRGHVVEQCSSAI